MPAWFRPAERSKSSAIEKISDAEWQRHLDLNVTTAFNVSRRRSRSCAGKRHGRIVNIASVTGPMVTNPRSAGYSSGKAAMTGLTRAIAIDTASRGITCNAVLPGWIATASSSRREIVAGKATPVGRPGSPMRLPRRCVFLAGDEASYVTGAMIVVDGGNSIVEFKGQAMTGTDDWSGKIVLIVGGGGGIGSATAPAVCDARAPAWHWPI